MDNKSAATGKGAWLRLKRHFVEAFSGEILSPQQSSRNGDASRDEWRDRRRRNAYRYILVFLAAVLLPLALFTTSSNQLLPSIGLIVLLALVLANIILLNIASDVLISPHWLLLFAIVLVMASLYEGTSFSLYLLFPLLVALPVLLDFRWAVGLGLLSAVVVTPMVLQRYDPMTAAIIGFSLALTWVVSAWLVFAVTEQGRRLRGMTITDPLTGAYNRRYLEIQAGRAFEAWTRYGTPVAVMLIDIDYFKRINDRFGHAAGDLALKAFVDCARSRVRKADFLCRFGGEEFVLLLTETTGLQAERLATELLVAVENLQVLPEGKMTVSIGICDVERAESVEHWLKLADNALYSAKRSGRNCVRQASDTQPAIVPVVNSIPHWR